MPWYWSDDVASALFAAGRLDSQVAAELSIAPVAFRCESDTIDDAARELAEDGEIPLAA